MSEIQDSSGTNRPDGNSPPPVIRRGESGETPPARSHRFTSFPVAVVILLHFVTCGVFSFFWLNLLHGKLPRVRTDDPSAGRAVGFCFIPFFNLYWIFFSYRRLCLRVDEQRGLYGLPPGNLRGLATAECIFQVIPYVNALIGYTIVTPIFLGLIQSSINQLVEKSATTAPKTTLPVLSPAVGISGLIIALIVCSALVVPAILAAMLLPALSRAKNRAQRINCALNLKQIGLAFRTWELDHGDQFPFNVSTNQGGSLELCAPGADSLDRNSWMHFLVLSNELATPRILWCPADKSKTLLRREDTTQGEADFGSLHAENVTYLVHSGTNVNVATPQSILILCPIHHTVVFTDGSVQYLTEAAMLKLLHQPATGSDGRSLEVVPGAR